MAVYKTKHYVLTGEHYGSDTLLEYYQRLEESRGKDSKATKAVGGTSGWYFALTGVECSEVSGAVGAVLPVSAEIKEFWSGEFVLPLLTDGADAEYQIIRLWDSERFFPHPDTDGTGFVLLVPPEIGEEWGLNEFVEGLV